MKFAVHVCICICNESLLVHAYDSHYLTQLMQTTTGGEWKSAHVDCAHFYTNKDIDRLILETEVNLVYLL